VETILISRQNLEKQVELLNICFPNSKIDKPYLEWLYYMNPLGNVVGFDSFEGENLVSHYACIPTKIQSHLGLLSINTATHPDYRSQGLYQKLANLTYDKWSNGYDFVVGVANSNSAAVFIKRLGFSEIGRLNLRFGDLQLPGKGSRSWETSDIEWRTSSPRKNFKKKTLSDGVFELSTRPSYMPFRIKSLISTHVVKPQNYFERNKPKKLGFTIDWVRGYNPKFQLPPRLKPSPLVLILKTFNNNKIEIDSWSFPDFDAY